MIVPLPLRSHHLLISTLQTSWTKSCKATGRVHIVYKYSSSLHTAPVSLRTTTPPSPTKSATPPTRHHSTTTTTKMSAHAHTTTDLTSADLMALLANRRSYYKLNAESPIPDTQIQKILEDTLHTVPSAFNTQSTRLVLALGAHHDKIWEVTTTLLRAKMGEERWASAPTAAKLAGFRAARGTVLFYDDRGAVEAQKATFPAYAAKFDAWTEQAQGMHQLAVWTALEAEGLGANLQHYDPVIDRDLAESFALPPDWVLKAQLVFGAVADGERRPDPKEKKKFDETLKVFGLEA